MLLGPATCGWRSRDPGAIALAHGVHVTRKGSFVNRGVTAERADSPPTRPCQKIVSGRITIVFDLLKTICSVGKKKNQKKHFKMES